MIDVFVIMVLIYGFVGVGAVFSQDFQIPTLITIAYVVAAPLICFGYPIISESLWRGRTLGKSIAGLRVVTSQGAPVRFRHAVIRGLLGMVEYPISGGIVPLVVMFVDQQGRRLGDIAAGTVVIRTRQVVGRGAQPVQFSAPAGSGDFTRSLDVSRLGDELHQAVRSFLLRASQLTPEARWSLAVKFATAASRTTNVVPPSDMHPETFLVSVIAARQRTTQQQQVSSFTGSPAPELPLAPAPAPPLLSPDSLVTPPAPAPPSEPGEDFIAPD